MMGRLPPQCWLVSTWNFPLGLHVANYGRLGGCASIAGSGIAVGAGSCWAAGSPGAAGSAGAAGSGAAARRPPPGQGSEVKIGKVTLLREAANDSA